MPTLLERRLLEFVDREDEMRAFCQMLDGSEKCIMFVHGDSGLGKSSLLARMVHETATRKVVKAEVVWTDTRPHDYLAVMRKVRDDLDPVAFSAFTDLVNFYTKEQYELTIKVEGLGAVRVADQAHVSQSQVGDIAGIIVKDFMINAPRADMAVPDAERMARLTDRFLVDLRTFLDRAKVVVFFDAVEKMSPDTAKWLWGELLTPLRDDQLRNLIVVLCGQRKPELEREWETCLEVTALQPLGHGHIVEYLARRGISEEHRIELATMLLAQTDGRVAAVAKAVDAFLKLQARLRTQSPPAG